MNTLYGMINKEYYSKNLKYHLEEKVIYNHEEHTICFIHGCGLVNLQSKDGFYKHGVHQHSLKKSG